MPNAVLCWFEGAHEAAPGTKVATLAFDDAIEVEIAGLLDSTLPMRGLFVP